MEFLIYAELAFYVLAAILLVIIIVAYARQALTPPPPPPPACVRVPVAVSSHDSYEGHDSYEALISVGLVFFWLCYVVGCLLGKDE
jgi:hypothetical protein